MNYAEAKAIVTKHAPNLILDPEVPGQLHICVRANAKSAPFSIMLPTPTDDPAADAVMLVASLAAAKDLFGVGK